MSRVHAAAATTVDAAATTVDAAVASHNLLVVLLLRSFLIDTVLVQVVHMIFPRRTVLEV